MRNNIVAIQLEKNDVCATKMPTIFKMNNVFRLVAVQIHIIWWPGIIRDPFKKQKTLFGIPKCFIFDETNNQTKQNKKDCKKYVYTVHQLKWIILLVAYILIKQQPTTK